MTKESEKTVEFNGKSLPERMGLRPLARELGIAHTTLLSHEKNGHVMRGPDKRFSVQEVISYRSSIPDDVKARGEKQKNESSAPAPPSMDSVEDSDAPSIAVSKARKEHWLAEQARIKAERAMGQLIVREDVEATLETIGSEIVTNLRNLVPKLKPHMSDDGKKVLDKAIDAALRDIGKKLVKILEEQDGED